MTTKFLDGGFAMIAFDASEMRALAKSIAAVLPELEMAVFEGDMDSDLLDDLQEQYEALVEALEDV